MTDRELMQMALDALEAALSNDQPYISRSEETAEALRARLANEFNPDWDAMAVMVEEQQRMAKRIEELESALAQPEPEPTRSQKLRDAGYTRRPKGWGKDEEEPEPVAWGFQNTGITGSNRWMYLKETIPKEDQYRGVFWTPLYTAPPQRELVGLTDEEIMNLIHDVRWQNMVVTTHYLARAIEAKLKEKNA